MKEGRRSERERGDINDKYSGEGKGRWGGDYIKGKVREQGGRTRTISGEQSNGAVVRRWGIE